MTRAPASLCPVDESHGPVLLIGDRYWCPHSGHDAERTRPAVPRYRPVLQDGARSFGVPSAPMGSDTDSALGAAPINGRDRRPGVGTPSKVRRSIAGLTPG